jgi:hypothetical protein
MSSVHGKWVSIEADRGSITNTHSITDHDLLAHDSSQSYPCCPCLVAFLKGLRPAVLRRLLTIPTPSMKPPQALASPPRVAVHSLFNFPPTLFSILTRENIPHLPPSSSLPLFCRRHCRCHRHYPVFCVFLIRVFLTTRRDGFTSQ